MYGAKYSDFKGEWFSMWEEDVKSILATMYKNMSDDLSVGYDPFGMSIKKELEDIAEYRQYIDNCYETFKPMAEEAVDHWCFYELKKKGAIL